MSTTDLRRRLVRVDNTITQFKSALAKLERHRIILQRQLHTIATYPVLTLPVELTTHIFSLCLPTIKELRESGPSFSGGLKTTPMLFLAVCRAWREIALATPALWSTLQIRFETIPQNVASEPELVEEFVDQWLGRAALRPLSILFQTSRYDDDDYTVTPSRVRDIIHRYAHRMVYLELHSSQSEIRQLELDLASFPLLQRALIGDVDDSRPNPLNPVDVFSNAPQLCELEIFDSAVYSSYTPPALQLTKFEGEITDLEIFSVAPNLIEVKCSMNYLLHVPPTVITHPRLQFLTLLKTPSGFESVNIFPHLALPALLSLDISDSSQYIDPESILSFLTRSAAPLHTLSVNLDAYDDWAGSLALLDNTLENLKVYSPSQAFLVTFMYLGSDYLRYPSLSRLRTVSFINSPHIDFKLLVKFLARRSTSPALAKLQSFRLDCQAGTFLDDGIYFQSRRVEATDHLARLARTGMDIYIGSFGRTKPCVEHVNARISIQ
ncbi:hypothetical protein B0H11DRAFT_2219227 [Mycena galericulata]|nr:hypothetical protein B0H11DRAFT_2219227 [Mycena galericulata]